jgi:hypothetical protein
MHDPRKQDEVASLTQSVRQFRRAARLAAADPLRLLALDPLTRLASLSAPIAALIDIAPFERLRQTVAAPEAASRRTARGRLQHFIGGDAAVRTRPAPVASASSHEAATGHAAPAAARQVTSPPASHVPSGPERLRREAGSVTTLAERRAALRRGNVESRSPSRPTSGGVAQAEARTGSGHTPFAEAREIQTHGHRQRTDEEADLLRQLAAVPFEPAAIDREDASAPIDVPFGLDDLHGAARQPWSIDERQAASRRNDDTFAPAAAAPFGVPPADEASPSAARRGRADLSPSAAAEDPSPHFPGLSPTVAQTTPPADADATRRRRASDPKSEVDLADALFETLYRDGVDRSWP